MWSDVLLTLVLVLFLASFVWLSIRFLQKKRQERIEILTQEFNKIEKTSPSITTALEKTKENFFSKLTKLLSSETPLNENILKELEAILFSADIGVKTSDNLISSLKEQAKNGQIKTSFEAKEALKKSIQGILLSTSHQSLELNTSIAPTVVMFIGVNGVGKTTSIGKIATLLTKQNKRVVLGAGDTFRAAAASQLAIWAERSGALIVTGQENADPASVLFDAVQKGKSEKADFILCDTAGRLHTKTNLMDELKKIHHVISKALFGAPHEVLLVVDATTGQNAIMQAKQFSAIMPLTGIILTKLDGTAKGGIVIGIVDELQIPIRYVGVGESVDDLKAFDAKEFVETLFI